MSKLISIAVEELRSFCTEVLQRLDMSVGDSSIVVEVLTDADLQGLDTHGVRLLPGYVRGLRAGYINSQPQMRIVKESAHYALIDGDHGMGQVVSVKAMQTCIAKAKRNKAAIVNVMNSSHFGAARYYSSMALAEELIGFSATNTPPWLAAPGSTVAVLGNNPFSFAFPAGNEPPIVFDMTCSVVGVGKVNQAIEAGQKIPPEWGLDKDGKPTEDPEVALHSRLQPPLGGYKGFVLALMIEILTGVFAGGLVSLDIPFLQPPGYISHLFVAIDPQLFTGPDEFKARMDNLIKLIRSQPLLGGGMAYLPGDRARIEREKRRAEGIPLLPVTLRQLEQLGKELGIRDSLTK